jgi:polysaccharide biosynthesis protein VpsQ
VQKWLLFTTALFALLIVVIVVAANADALPLPLERLTKFPCGDKTGHFVLFGTLSFLVNKSALILFPKRTPARLILTVSLLLCILIGLEEWSQSLFPARTMSLNDLLASYAGVFVSILVIFWTNR